MEAQPCYSEALGLISKEYKDFPKVSKRSEVLDELVIYVEAVQLQDSLQTLARMPEAERLAVVDRLIKEHIKREEEAKREAEREEYRICFKALLRGGRRGCLGDCQAL